MAKSTLTKRIEFSASHRYHNPNWDTARNEKVFGLCSQEHGHNYLLEVTLHGRVDPVTGMIINLYDLKHIVTEILEEFDHKHLNLDTPYFEKLIPTTENLALVLWRKFRNRQETRDLHTIRLYEGEDLWAELRTPHGNGTIEPPVDQEEPSEASITRRYVLTVYQNTVLNTVSSDHLLLDVAICDSIDPDTGRVTDIAVLDRIVRERVLARFDGKNLSEDRAFHSQPVNLTTLAKVLWDLLSDVTDGQLDTITLQDQYESKAEIHRHS